MSRGRPRRASDPLASAVDVPPSRSEHLLNDGENTTECRWRKPAEMTNKALVIDGAKLIDDDVTARILEAARHTKRKRLPTRRERRNHDGTEMRVEVIG